MIRPNPLHPNKNIALAVDSIDDATLSELVDTFPDRIGYLLTDTPERLRDLEREEFIRRLKDKGGLSVILDAQLSGGFGALVDRATMYERLFNPEFITVGAGITLQGLKRVVEAASHAGILVTGVLPEISMSDLGTTSLKLTSPGDDEHRIIDPRNVTRECARMATAAGAAGVYGSAHDAHDLDWHVENLYYVATGISPDGLPYSDKDPGNVTSLSEAFSLGATVATVGSSLNEPRFNADTVDKKVELFHSMLTGVVLDTFSEVQ